VVIGARPILVRDETPAWAAAHHPHRRIAPISAISAV
jgi:hypothetical protein